MADKTDKLDTLFGTLLSQVNNLAAALPEAEVAAQAQGELARAGLPGAQTYSPAEVLDRYDEPEEKAAAEIGQVLSDENKATRQYLELARQGHTLLLVKAEGDESAQKAAAILKRLGAAAIRHYGPLTFKEL
jgi:hypothetical protein